MEIYSLNTSYARELMMEDYNDFDSRQDAMRNFSSLNNREDDFDVDEFGDGEDNLGEILNEFGI